MFVLALIQQAGHTTKIQTWVMKPCNAFVTGQLVFSPALVAGTSHVPSAEAVARVHPQCLKGSAPELHA